MPLENSRKLAAIMFTDIVGYTSIMQEDENNATVIRNRHKNVLEEQVYLSNGKILQFFGDGTLSIFESAVNAVDCAIRIQNEFKKEPQIPLRIGLHSGDIVFDESGVYGDGVNIASRIESSSVAGGILISDKIYDDIKNHPSLKVKHLGEQKFKNVSAPVTIYAITGEGLVVPEELETSLSRSISIAVLPLQNLSDAPGIDIFCKGLLMDIINDLSRFRSLQLISYDATKNIDPEEGTENPAIHDMQLDYLVKGMVRSHNDQLVFNLQLINARQNRLVWAEKFKGSLDEIFQIQEEIVEKIAVSLQKFVDHDLLSELRKKPITKLNAYECWLKGMEEVKKGTLEADEQARIYFQNAIDIDPHYARAYTGMSLTYFNEWSCQIWDRWEVSQKGAFEWAQKAVELDEWDHVSTVILGKIYLFNGEYDKAEYHLRKALRLNPNDAENLIRIAMGFGYLGLIDEALELYEKAKRLNPTGGDGYFSCGAFLNFEAGKIDNAIELAEKQSGSGWVDFQAYKAAAYFHKGEQEKMSESWHSYLNTFKEKINQGRETDNLTALKWMMDVNPYRSNTQLKPFWQYMGQGAELTVPQKKSSASFLVNHFIKEGDLWKLSFSGNQVQMQDLKGFHDIYRLLSAPNTAIHCTELAGAAVVEKGEEVIDDKARQKYQKRIMELQSELSEAEAGFNSDQISKLQQEYDDLIEHLSKVTGIGGKIRKKSGTIEKARTSVTWRIRNAIKKINEVHPPLGKHLENSIKTGIFCEYSPEQEVDWLL